MNLRILFFLLFISSSAFGQTYTSLVTEAKSLTQHKEYTRAIEKYREAFKIEQKNANDLYNAGCVAALANQKESAFQWLRLAFQKGWINTIHLKTDTDLVSLHDSPKWKQLVEEMQKEQDKKEALYDKPLQAKLLTIFDEDQKIRRSYVIAEKRFGRKSPKVDSIVKIMAEKDSMNLRQVTDVLDNYGWVGADKVGGKANQTLFLVIQHAPLPIQQKYLPMMREAVRNKQASGSSLALLEDRVALGEGKRQTYGSQIGFDETKQQYYVLPLDNPEHVDERRQSVGLGSLADYVKNWNIVWDVEMYKKQLPELEKKKP